MRVYVVKPIGLLKKNLHFLVLLNSCFIHINIVRKLRKNFGYENAKRKKLRNIR